jgi:hypothetical protein
MAPLRLVGIEIENPFGHDTNDLPLDILQHGAAEYRGFDFAGTGSGAISLAFPFCFGYGGCHGAIAHDLALELAVSPCTVITP